MENTFKALILTYKTAPVVIRERVSLNEAGAKKLLNFIKDFTPATDALVVSTCNRTEIYYQAEKDLSIEIFKGLKLIKSLDEAIEDHFVSISGVEAVKHLFEVGIGLDAQVIGDLQISGQVKNAYQWCAEEGMAGPFLHRLMHTIFFANKRVVQETSFRDGAASISYAATELADQLTSDIGEPSILVVGVGEIGEDVCLNLSSAKFKNVTVLNRTIEKAEKLASKCGYAYSDLSTLKEHVAKADVIISSVAAESPIISQELLKGIEIISHKSFIDLSMPRSVEGSVETIPGVDVYNLDHIQEKTNEALEKRRASIPLVQGIISEAISDFEDWSKEMVVSPTIQKLKNALEQIRKEELARYIKNARPEEALKLEEMSKSLMQKILKYPVLQLKAACKRGDAESLTEVLNELFNLEGQVTESGNK